MMIHECRIANDPESRWKSFEVCRWQFELEEIKRRDFRVSPADKSASLDQEIRWHLRWLPLGICAPSLSEYHIRPTDINLHVHIRQFNIMHSQCDKSSDGEC